MRSSDRYRAIALFAKSPAPGLVKTRLMPALSERQAAQLAAAFLHDTSRWAVEAAAESNASAICMFTPASAAEELSGILPPQMLMKQQVDGDLTDRLSAAYSLLANEGFTNICFIGADSPTLPKARLSAAFDHLEDGDDLVIGPASDGGYYLLALREPHLELFTGIAWSTSDVFSQTLARASNLGLVVRVLPEWFDVDDAASLRRLRLELCEDQSQEPRASAPETYRLLTSWRGLVPAIW